MAGPLEAFAAATREDGSPGYRLETWSLGPLAVRSESGLRLLADRFAPTPLPADPLIVAGGRGVREPRTGYSPQTGATFTACNG